MNQIEAEQLRMEIAHIFNSGANEIRIFEMVKSFTERRSQVNKLPIHSVSDSEQVTISKKEYDWLKKCEKDLGSISFSL